MIPRIIHYCWLSEEPIPERLQRYVAEWHHKLPDYEFVFWDHSCLKKFATIPWFNEAFDAGMYAFAADFVRFYAVYTMGGIYLDMDVELLRPFDELLDRPYLFGAEYDDFPEAGIFGAEAHNELIRLCMDFYENKHFILDQQTLSSCKAPQVMHDAIAAHCSIEVSESLSNDPGIVTLLPSDYLTAMHADTGIAHPTANTRTIHHFAGTWCYQTPMSRFRRWLKVTASCCLGETLARRISQYFH